MLEVKFLKAKKQKSIVLTSGGVKEEQVLDAFKILFSDNQVDFLFNTIALFPFDCILGQSCSCQYFWWNC